MTPEEAIKLREGDKVWVPNESDQSVNFYDFCSISMGGKGFMKVHCIGYEPMDVEVVYETENEAWNAIIKWHEAQIKKHRKSLAELRKRVKEVPNGQ